MTLFYHIDLEYVLGNPLPPRQNRVLSPPEPGKEKCSFHPQKPFKPPETDGISGHFYFCCCAC